MALTKEELREMTLLALTTPQRKEPNLYVTFFSVDEEFSFSIRDYGVLPWDGVVEWSIDKKQWSVFSRYDTPISENGYLYLRGTSNTHFCSQVTSDESALFDPITVGLKVTGNIETLLDYQTVARRRHPNMSRYCFQGMFHNWSGLAEGPEMPAVQLSERCYSRMFWGCTSLISAPDLPAKQLAKACYAEMFRECTNLIIPPELSAELTSEDEEVYMGMFYGCKSLTTLPELRSTVLPRRCYYSMFQDCENIKLASSQDYLYSYEYRIPREGVGVSESSSVNRMFRDTGGPFTGTPSINTTYYTNNKPI